MVDERRGTDGTDRVDEFRTFTDVYVEPLAGDRKDVIATRFDDYDRTVIFHQIDLGGGSITNMGIALSSTSHRTKGLRQGLEIKKSFRHTVVTMVFLALFAFTTTVAIVLLAFASFLAG